jgi:DNA polymerase
MPNELKDLIAEVRENVLFLQELGISGLDADLKSLQKVKAPAVEKTVKEPAQFAPPPAAEARREAKTQPAAESETKNAPSSLRDRLDAAKLSRLTVASGTGPGNSSPVSAAKDKKPAEADSAGGDSLFGDLSPANELAPTEETLADIHNGIAGCRLCRLHEGRTQIVNSTGNPKANLMFIGEAPGADEDAQGLPFVGRAGQLLTKIIEAMGLDRAEVFIGNINRCRPPGNRAPQPDEVAMCKPFLLREIAVVRPRVIVVLGNTAMQNLLEIKTPIGKLRGNFQDYFGIKVMPTFHPAYLLRDPHKKREVWEDMKKVKAFLDTL